MFTLWSDLDRALFGNRMGLARANSIGRQLEELLTERRADAGRMNLWDQGEELVFVAELPGVDENHVEATVHREVLTIRAERNLDGAEGRAHRQERRPYQIQRSISLPTPVDADKIKATMKDGILKIHMAKAPEHKPRQITVNGN